MANPKKPSAAKKTAKKAVKKAITKKASQEKKNLALFIDGNNFRHGLKALLRSEHIDWKTFVEELERDYKITQAHYYIGKVTYPLFEQEKVKEQEKLLRELKRVGIIPWLGYFNDDKHEKGVDVQIALDLAIGAVRKNYEVAMLISGDGDLSNAIKIAQKVGARVILGYIAGTRKTSYRISWILKGMSDSQTALNAQVKKAHEVWKKKNVPADPKKAAQKTASKKAAKKPAKKSSTTKKGPEHLLVFSDGGSRGNPGPSGCGVALCDEKGIVVGKVKAFLGKMTNNQAEYMGLLHGLAAAEKLKPKKITCYLDSKLVVEQVSKRWKVKNKDLKEYFEQVQLFLLKHPDTSFHHIPREKNQLADQLANEAMDEEEKKLKKR